MTPEQKAHRLERLRWRYHNDPAYRERVLEQQREYRKRPEYQAKTLERKRRWRKTADPDHLRAKRQEWHAAEAQKPESRRRYVENARRWKLARMGTTPEEVAAVRKQQDGRCAICGRRPTRPLHVDHCHSTGRFRALLCHSCNAGLGMFQDSPEVLTKAIQYVEKWAAAHQEEAA